MRPVAALIVGGGPAGAAAAIGLARAGLPHLLVERSRETGDTLCGGFLSWRTLAALDGLGVAADALNPLAITRVRLFAGRGRSEARLPRPARGVSRRRLDALMLARAEGEGAAVERGVTVRGIDGLVARTADGAELAAGALFLASGKHDIRGLARPADAAGRDPALGLRVRLGPATGLSRLIGDAIELHLFDRGYAGLVVQEDGSANLCLAVRRSRLSQAGSPDALLRALGAEQPHLAERLAWWDGRATIDAVANVPYGWRRRDGAARLFRLGDQAGVIPSLAGEGMGIAIASGIAAAAAYTAGGADAATIWQRSFDRRIARPITVARAVLAAGERPIGATTLVTLSRFAPAVVGLVARLTRVAA